MIVEMNMRKFVGRLTVVVVSSLVLLGCGEQAEVEAPEVIRPVKSMLVSSPDSATVRVFPGVIDANQKVNLAFRVAGKLKLLPVKEGETVEKGQVIAQLDKTDFEIVARDRRARYTESRANFDRAARLLPKGHISKADYDRLESTFKSADAALAEASQNLKYTTLKAPFSGRVAKRHVENFEEVQAKQTVIELQDISALEVKIDIPEGDIRRMREGSVQPKILASFGDGADKKFDLVVKEFATVADTQTQTFRVTLGMEKPVNFTVLPGMTTSVEVDMSNLDGPEVEFIIPLSAISGDIKQHPEVWVIDEQSMVTAPVPITVGAMQGSSIQVLGGLEEGQRIVTAGVSFLVDGMKVRLQPEVEQAEPLVDQAPVLK